MAAEDNHRSLAVYEEWKAKQPNIVFIIERSKNKNIVVYEVRACVEGGLVQPRPLISVCAPTAGRLKEN